MVEVHGAPISVIYTLSLHDALPILQTLAFPLVAEFGWTKEIEDRLMAPMPTSFVAISRDRKSTRLNSSHVESSYAGLCLKKKIPQGHFLRFWTSARDVVTRRRGGSGHRPAHG